MDFTLASRRFLLRCSDQPNWPVKKAIKHDTGIMVSIDGKVVGITANELKKQAQEKNETEI